MPTTGIAITGGNPPGPATAEVSRSTTLPGTGNPTHRPGNAWPLVLDTARLTSPNGQHAIPARPHTHWETNEVGAYRKHPRMRGAD